jgi:hypothetical protein
MNPPIWKGFPSGIVDGIPPQFSIGNWHYINIIWEKRRDWIMNGKAAVKGLWQSYVDADEPIPKQYHHIRGGSLQLSLMRSSSIKHEVFHKYVQHEHARQWMSMIATVQTGK